MRIFFYVFLSLGDRYDRFESASLLSLCKPLSLSNFNLFFVCSLTRRLQDCFNKTFIHWRPWWMIWIGRYLIRCGWHDLNLSFIFYLNIRKQNKCFTTRLRWSAMKPALPLVKKILLIWLQKYNVNLMQSAFVDNWLQNYCSKRKPWKRIYNSLCSSHMLQVYYKVTHSLRSWVFSWVFPHLPGWIAKTKTNEKRSKTSKIRKPTNSCDHHVNLSLDEPNQFIWSWGLYVGESNRGDFEQI